MINIPPTKAVAEIKAERLPDITKLWKVGQILNARVETSADALSKTLLRIGQNIVEARTPIPLQKGDPVQLLVKSLGETPLLSIQTPTSTASIATDKLKLFIAQQQGILNLVKISHQLLADEHTDVKTKQLINELINKLPIINQVGNASQLKKLIQNSGIFLESKILLQQGENIQTDVKAQLLKLINHLQLTEITFLKSAKPNAEQVQKFISQFINSEITPKQLAHFLNSSFSINKIHGIQSFLPGLNNVTLPLTKTDPLNSLNALFIHIQKQANSKQIIEVLLSLLKNASALQVLKTGIEQTIAKITSQQLIPLTKEADNFLVLLFDILIKDKDEHHLINFKIEEESNNKENENTSWTVTINFEFKSLGKIQAKIQLIENRVSTLFSADKSSTVNKIGQYIGLLETAYKKAGFDVMKLDVSYQTHENNSILPDGIHLLDDNA